MFGFLKKPALKDSLYEEKPNWQQSYEEKTSEVANKFHGELKKISEFNTLETVEEKLEAANILKSNIDAIDNFLYAAENVWTGTLVSSHYGIYKSRYFKLDTDLKNQMLDVLRKRRVEYVQQIQEIMEFKEESNANS